MGDFQTVAKQFVDFYYQHFDSDRNQLASLYRPNSMLTFESDSRLGAESIVEKLVNLPFAKVKHETSTLDAQPGPVEGSVIILVTGRLLVDEEQRPMSYTQSFQLMKDNQGFFVFNDFFKLVYA